MKAYSRINPNIGTLQRAFRLKFVLGKAYLIILTGTATVDITAYLEKNFIEI